MDTPILYIFSGLPGTGKSTLSKRLAAHTGATWLRIDTLEQGLRDHCNIEVEGEGYRIAYRIASDNLRLGSPVIADSCNPCELTREEWREVAILSGARWVDIEVVCSDQDEHRIRIETRKNEVPGLRLPSWQDVLDRDYEKWTEDRIVIDTATTSIDRAFQDLLKKLWASRTDQAPANFPRNIKNTAPTKQRPAQR
ncbi:AAA family ATPase [Puniceicoccus vermicola]|uniref:AAA family ATPase n=1 Tax=Puniceicoccus vermicola TaxID=388746 RepID=A0A7X1AWW1_9BACT|nr:AAA family ATPase [Puniceicoccus vermicola]MBC2601269.1 AAA family ATPase [Puniceicoccus vermicola]